MVGISMPSGVCFKNGMAGRVFNGRWGSAISDFDCMAMAWA